MPFDSNVGAEATSFVASLAEVVLSIPEGAGRRALLQGVSAEFPAGAISAILGPSGSGKSSLLAVLGGLVTADSGRTVVNGTDLGAMPEARRCAFRREQVGFIFQDIRLLPQLTAIDNVIMPTWLRYRDRQRAELAAARSMRAVGMEHKALAMPATMSGGERQLVALARALSCDPHLILADEPTASLDWRAAELFLTLLRERVADSRRAAVIVTHDPRVIDWVDHLFHLEGGKLRYRHERRPPSPRRAVTALAAWIAVFAICLSGATAGEAAAAESSAFAAPGRVEGISPTVKMGFAVTGVVKDVLTSPGARVSKGAPLAAIHCEDRQAGEAVAEAELAEAKAQQAKLRQGTRPEEKKIAAANLQAYEAEALASVNVYGRMDALRGKGGMITELQHEAAADAVRTARARVAIANSQLELANAPARPEEIAAAQARQAAAAARLQLARAETGKCVLRAPADATVLRVDVERGDVVSITPPKIAVTLSDLSRLRVRAEVDERFVERVRIGQPVTISSDFNLRLKLPGKVVARENQMGRRSTLGIDPADKNDRDVLEVIVEVDGDQAAAPAASLPVGYRVIVSFR